MPSWLTTFSPDSNPVPVAVTVWRVVLMASESGTSEVRVGLTTGWWTVRQSVQESTVGGEPAKAIETSRAPGLAEASAVSRTSSLVEESTLTFPLVTPPPPTVATAGGVKPLPVIVTSSDAPGAMVEGDTPVRAGPVVETS